MYLNRVRQGLQDLEPGATLPVPISVGGKPILMLVQRGSGADSELCTLAVVSCEAEALSYHRAQAAPPKIKFETCLELHEVQLDKLRDDALWAVLWFVSSSDPNNEDARLSPLKMMCAATTHCHPPALTATGPHCWRA